MPLTERSLEELQQSNQGLSNRIDSLINSDDVAALLDAEAATPPEQQEAFWKATELADDNVDQLVELLQDSTEY